MKEKGLRKLNDVRDAILQFIIDEIEKLKT